MRLTDTDLQCEANLDFFLGGARSLDVSLVSAKKRKKTKKRRKSFKMFKSSF